MALSIEKLAGVYYLHSIKETESIFRLNANGTFQFFFIYGALNRYGSGNWTLENDIVMLQSKPWFGSDFKMTSSDTSGVGITIKVSDPDPVFQKNILASLKTGEEGSWRPPDANGVIHFPMNEAEMITLSFEFCLERLTFFPIREKQYNYFEFRLEPWALEVFFDRFILTPKRRLLIGGHPLLRGKEFIYEKE